MDFVLTCLGPFLIANTRDEKVPLTGTVKVKFANEERIGRDRMLDSLPLCEVSHYHLALWHFFAKALFDQVGWTCGLFTV